MSGIEKITARLLEECGAECASIEDAASLSAANTLAAAETQAGRILEEAKEKAGKDAQRIIAGAESAAEVNARRELLKAKVDLIDESLRKAQWYLHSLNTEDYFKVLFSLAARSRQSGVGEMHLNTKDLARMPASFLQQLGAGIRVSDEPYDIEDGFILVYGDIEMNCTFSALFAANREELKAKAAEILFGNGR